MNKARLLTGFIFVSLLATTVPDAQEWGTPAFAVERRYEVAEASTFATPVLLGSNILVRDATGLILLTTGK